MDNEQQIKKEYDNISNKLLSENPVCELSGEEFSPIEGKTLKQQVIDYFNTCGNSASTQFGNVLFDEKGIKNALHHGMSRIKAIAFAAIKPTLENGTIILPLDYYNVHGKKQKTGMIAAPIIIKEEKNICVVEVIDNTITNRLYAHEVFLTKNLIEDVADTIAVLGAETPVTHPQGEVAKILKNYIQNAYSKEEILDYLNNIQDVDNECDKNIQTNNDNNDDNKHPKINESSCIKNNRKIYKTNMTHIKRIDEMVKSPKMSVNEKFEDITNWSRDNSNLESRIGSMIRIFQDGLSGYGNKMIIDGLNNEFIEKEFECDDYDIVTLKNESEVWVLFNHESNNLIPEEKEFHELDENVQKIIYDDFIDFMNKHYFDNMRLKSNEL